MAAVQPYRGNFHVEWYKKIASHAFAVGEFVIVHSTGGFLHPLVDGVATPVVGICLKKVASTDSDYASNTLIPVLVGAKNAEWLCTAATGCVQAHVGLLCDADDSTTLDTDSGTYDLFLVTKYISDTQCVAKIADKGGVVATTTYSS